MKLRMTNILFYGGVILMWTALMWMQACSQARAEDYPGFLDQNTFGVWRNSHGAAWCRNKEYGKILVAVGMVYGMTNLEREKRGMDYLYLGEDLKLTDLAMMYCAVIAGDFQVDDGMDNQGPMSLTIYALINVAQARQTGH